MRTYTITCDRCERVEELTEDRATNTVSFVMDVHCSRTTFHAVKKTGDMCADCYQFVCDAVELAMTGPDKFIDKLVETAPGGPVAYEKPKPPLSSGQFYDACGCDVYQHPPGACDRA